MPLTATVTMVAVAVMLSLGISACLRGNDEPPAPDRSEPRALAEELIVMARDGDWQGVQASLVPGYEEFDPDVLGLALFRARSLSDQFPVSDDLDLDRWLRADGPGDLVLLRLEEVWPLALLFREVEDDVWVLDPGPLALAWARFLTDLPDPSAPQEMSPPDGYMVQWIFSPDEEDPTAIARRFSESLEGITVEDEYIDVTFDWFFRSVVSARLPLDDVHWQLGERRGVAEVVWTTADVADSQVVFPFPEVDDVERASMRYFLTFRLHGATVYDEVELFVGGVQLSDPTGYEATFDLLYHVPTDPYPGVPTP